MLQHLQSPKTELELAALTGLHIQGVQLKLKALTAEGLVDVVGIKKVARKPHENLYGITKRVTKEVKAKRANSATQRVEEQVLQALEAYGNMRRAEIMEKTGLTVYVVRAALKRLQYKNTLTLLKERKSLWTLTNGVQPLKEGYKFKTKFVNDRNPWL